MQRRTAPKRDTEFKVLCGHVADVVEANFPDGQMYDPRILPLQSISEDLGVKCEGCDVVGCDHAPQAGVAQGFDMDLSLGAELDIRKGWKKNGETR